MVSGVSTVPSLFRSTIGTGERSYWMSEQPRDQETQTKDSGRQSSITSGNRPGRPRSIRNRCHLPISFRHRQTVPRTDRPDLRPRTPDQGAAGSIPIDGCCAHRRRRVRAQNMRPRTLRWRIPFPRWPYRPQHRWPGGDIMAPFSASTAARTNSAERRLLSALQLGTARRGGREIEHSAFQINLATMPADEIQSRHKSDLSRREQRAQPRVVLQGKPSAFPELDGSHMQLRLPEWEWQIVSRRGSTLAVVNRGMRWPGWFRGRKVRWVHIPGGPEYRRERGHGLRRVTYVDTDLGVAVIETHGMHSRRTGRPGQPAW